MGTLRIRAELLDTAAFDAFVDTATERSRDLRPLWNMMGDAFRTNESRIFLEQGPGWKPLSPAYAAWKTAHYGVLPILVRTGALRASLTSPNAPGSVNEMTPTTATFGTSNNHAMYHQTGNLNTSHYPLGTHPPKRPPVVITDALKRQWRSRVADFARRLVEEG